MLKDCHNDNLQEIELDDIPLEVQDFMNLKPCKNVLVIQRKDHKLYFYTNSQNCLKEKYSDYSIRLKAMSLIILWVILRNVKNHNKNVVPFFYYDLIILFRKIVKTV